RVLPVVAEDEEPPALGMVDHVLREDVHVGDVCRADGPRRLAIVAPDPASVRAAREAARQHARIVLFLAHGVELHERPGYAAGETASYLLGVCRPASAAEVDQRRARVLLQLLVVASADEPVDEHDAMAPLRLLERRPVV